MTMTGNRKAGRIGSSFDDFLKEDGIYEGVTAQAIKRVRDRQRDEEARREEKPTARDGHPD